MLINDKVLKILYTDACILHRDISPNNIMLVRNDDGTVLHALLIDFDYASTVEKDKEREVVGDSADVVDRFRTVSLFPLLSLIYLSSYKGTPPFMAIEILLQKGRTFHHSLRHDLESLYFVIIWICSHMEGPEVERKDTAHLAIRKWSDMEAPLQHLGHVKLAHVDDMEQTILPDITSYWEDLKPFIWQLKQAFFPVRAADPNCITAEKMTEILEKALSTVQECPSPGSSVEPTIRDVEMHEYDVLKYGKDYRRGQADAPRKRMKSAKSSPQPTRPSVRIRASQARTGDPSRSNVSKPSKLRDTSTSQGQNFGSTI